MNKVKLTRKNKGGKGNKTKQQFVSNFVTSNADRPQSNHGGKIGKIMRDFDMKFSEALAFHWQDKRLMKKNK